MQNLQGKDNGVTKITTKQYSLHYEL